MSPLTLIVIGIAALIIQYMLMVATDKLILRMLPFLLIVAAVAVFALMLFGIIGQKALGAMSASLLGVVGLIGSLSAVSGCALGLFIYLITHRNKH